MPTNTHLETISAEAELPERAHAAQDAQVIRQRAEELARALAWLPNTPSSRTFTERCRALVHDLKPIFAALELPVPDSPISDDFRWLYDNDRLLYTELQSVVGTLKSRATIPHVHPE